MFRYNDLVFILPRFGNVVSLPFWSDMFNKGDCILSSLNAEERLAQSPIAKRTQYSTCSVQNPDSAL